MRKQLLAVIALAGVAIGATIGIAVADSGLNDITPHRLFVGGQQVGPRICDHLDDPVMQGAFNQFHANHHNHNVTGGQGPVAPGINDELGPRLTATGC
jgi:hypothetical protein